MLYAIFNSDHYYIIYSLGFTLFLGSYFLFHKFLHHVNQKYRKLDEDKQVYVVSNILKSICLGIISPIAMRILYQTMYLDTWNNNLIKNMGSIYAIPDGVSLLLVNKMSLSTKIHHTVVCIFNFASIHSDYTQEGIIRCMVTYACLSSFSFIVNFLLGVRYLHNDIKLTKHLSRSAFLVYVSCCLMNWIWHVRYLSHLIGVCDDYQCAIGIPLYSIMTVTIVWDDIVLNKWLLERAYFEPFLN